MRGTQLNETVDFLYKCGAEEVHMLSLIHIFLYNASASDASKAASEQLDAGFLKGKRIGIVGDDPQQALARKIEACGAQAVPVELSEDGIDNEYIINQDFKNDLDRYLQTYQAPVKSLSDLVAFHQKDLSLIHISMCIRDRPHGISFHIRLHRKGTSFAKRLRFVLF